MIDDLARMTVYLDLQSNLIVTKSLSVGLAEKFWA
jgi:hypothetical protein